MTVEKALDALNIEYNIYGFFSFYAEALQTFLLCDTLYGAVSAYREHSDMENAPDWERKALEFLEEAALDGTLEDDF